MKLVEMKCPNCAAQMEPDAESGKAVCPHCGTTMLIDDEVQHVQVDNAESAGYEFEKGRQRAQEELPQKTCGKRRVVLMLVESALMIAIATGLSFWKIDLPFGGGVTIVSMFPLILISHRYGWKWGLLTAFAYSLLQLVFGLDNVGYATSFVMGVGIVLLDYVLAYTVIGLSGVFGKDRKAVAIGIAVTFFLRFLCHLVSGAWIWGEWMPDAFMGLKMTSPWLYSALYNGWYMLFELAATELVAMLSYAPLEKYFRGESALDLPKKKDK